MISLSKHPHFNLITWMPENATIFNRLVQVAKLLYGRQILATWGYIPSGQIDQLYRIIRTLIYDLKVQVNAIIIITRTHFIDLRNSSVKHKKKMKHQVLYPLISQTHCLCKCQFQEWREEIERRIKDKVRKYMWALISANH